MLSSHIKIAPYHLKKKKKTLKWNDLILIGVHILHRIVHGHLEVGNMSSRVEKYFTSERYFWREISYLRAAM